MKNYSALSNQVFQVGEYSLVPIRMEDRYDIMRWRNQQIFHLRQNQLLTTKDQDFYFENVVVKLFDQPKPSQILFSFLKNGNCIGYGGLVHINWIDGNAEISFIMDTELEKDHFATLWKEYLNLIEKVAFEEIGLHKIFTYAFDIRPHLYTVLESVGYKKDAVLKEHSLFNSEYIDVVIHSKFNDGDIWLVNASEEHTKTLFEWANDPIVRQNAFSSEKIKWEDHVNWLKNKLIDDNNRFYLLRNSQSFIGQARLDYFDNGWLISYSISQEFRNQGYGSKLIFELCKKVGDGERLIAEVKENNVSSVKVFKKLGFSQLKSQKEGVLLFGKTI